MLVLPLVLLSKVLLLVAGVLLLQVLSSQAYLPRLPSQLLLLLLVLLLLSLPFTLLLGQLVLSLWLATLAWACGTLQDESAEIVVSARVVGLLELLLLAGGLRWASSLTAT